jgi:hypothetical protein
VEQVSKKIRRFSERRDVYLPTFTTEIIVDMPLGIFSLGFDALTPPEKCTTVPTLKVRSTMV